VGSGDNVQSVAAGDEAAELLFLSRFLMVEFQKFLISLSVRPGSRAAIWDHLAGTQCRDVRGDFTVSKNKMLRLSEKASSLHVYARVNFSCLF
jgi:hypothetical protein